MKKFLLLILVSIHIQLGSYAQADLKTDAYVFVKNIWEDSLVSTQKFIHPWLQKKGVDTIYYKWLPLVNKLQYVQDHPYNWNDGAMVPAKGWQSFSRMGMNAKWKNWEVQIAPELVVAENKLFEDFPMSLDGVHWKDYYRFYNFIELPTRMGDRSYARMSFGQSFLKYKYKNFVVAASTENKWWGPMQRNPLLLSNSAAGFSHFSLSNQAPIETPIGKFDFETIMGTLFNGGWLPPDTAKSYYGEKLYDPKIPLERYINGINVSYYPKWVPNLRLGFEQMYIQYHRYMKNWENYFPIKNPISRFADDRITQPILITAFDFTYQFPEVDASIYGQWGWNLNHTTFRNWILQPDKGFASSLGLKKVFSKHSNHYWEVIAEATQLQLLTQSEQTTLGVPPSWYLGSFIRQGYTNDGQMLGAGIGPGGSSQFIEINRKQKNNRIGLMVERRVHNNDFYEFTFIGSKDFRRFYVDFLSTLKLDIQYKKWIVGPRLTYSLTNNYNWWLVQPNDTYFVNGKDVQQFMLQCNFQYHF